jgi:hypothetical protein
MEGAENPLVQVTKVIVSPANRAHFNGGNRIKSRDADPVHSDQYPVISRIRKKTFAGLI